MLRALGARSRPLSGRSGATSRGSGGRPRRAELCAVVKADGYGHGAARRGRAAALAAAPPGWRSPPRPRRARCGGAGSRPAAGAGGAHCRGAARRAGGRRRRDGLGPSRSPRPCPGSARVHVKLDTGMGRLGTRDPAIATRLADASLAPVMLAGAWTHFATADERGDSFFADQLDRFRDWAQPLARRSSRPASACRQQRGHPARRSEPFRHGPMRRCRLRNGSLR